MRDWIFLFVFNIFSIVIRFKWQLLLTLWSIYTVKLIKLCEQIPNKALQQIIILLKTIQALLPGRNAKFQNISKSSRFK